jgi:hypothetical protein
MQLHRISFLQMPWSAETVYLKKNQKGRSQGVELTSLQAARKRHRDLCALCGRLSGFGWGGLAQWR